MPQLDAAPYGSGSRCRAAATRRLGVGSARHEGLKISPVDRSIRRRTPPSPAQQAAGVGAETDIDTSQLPSVGQLADIDVRPAHHLYTLDVHQLARAKAISPPRRTGFASVIGAERALTLACSKMTSDTLTRTIPLERFASTPETRGRAVPASQCTATSPTLPTRFPSMSRTGRPSRFAREISSPPIVRRTAILSRRFAMGSRRRRSLWAPLSSGIVGSRPSGGYPARSPFHARNSTTCSVEHKCGIKRMHPVSAGQALQVAAPRSASLSTRSTIERWHR